MHRSGTKPCNGTNKTVMIVETSTNGIKESGITVYAIDDLVAVGTMNKSDICDLI